VVDWRIPLSDLEYDGEEEEAALNVIRSRWLSMGAEVETFEQEFSAFIGARHAVAVANGTAALHLAYLALGLGPGDEIIQPAINFVAAANMTLAVGATPVFGDIVSIGEPTLDPDEIRHLVTPRTKAVVVMHYGGYLARMADILQLCEEHGLRLVEDACHAVGACYIGTDPEPPPYRMAGNLGDVACFSFFSNKNLAVGEGGMISTNDDELDRRIRSLRSHGMTTLTWDRHRGHAHSYDVDAHGYNYRLDEIHAALGRVQLRKLRKNNEHRKRLVQEYKNRLSGLPGWTIPFADYHGDSAYHLAVLVAPDEKQRTRVAGALREARIQTSLHYPSIPQFKAFQAFEADSLPKSGEYCRRAITLPLFPSMTSEQIKDTCDAVLVNA
jgi:dTDP-4-amino-4,6-dideoxygalactose transaminase